MTLTKQQILEAADLPRQPVEVPEWGGGVWVRMMTAAERQAYYTHGAKLIGEGVKPVTDDALARLVAFTACDESGALLFGPADIPAIAGKSGVVVQRIADVAWELNQLGAPARKRAAKN